MVVLVYATLGIATGKEAGPVMTRAGLTTRVKLWLDEAPLASVAVTLTVYGVPVLVLAVPVMAPLALMANPAGKPVADHVIGVVPPVNVTVLPLV
jgi:hypothetical protein